MPPILTLMLRSVTAVVMVSNGMGFLENIITLMILQVRMAPMPIMADFVNVINLKKG